mmetsp:Transcript_30111/g.73146  ORF Transcript_30111/g.73146 Transcript_30111/m.73146 type:complete len:901 (+) Transcript_30111:2-2704(+)
MTACPPCVHAFVGNSNSNSNPNMQHHISSSTSPSFIVPKPKTATATTSTTTMFMTTTVSGSDIVTETDTESTTTSISNDVLEEDDDSDDEQDDFCRGFYPAAEIVLFTDRLLSEDQDIETLMSDEDSIPVLDLLRYWNRHRSVEGAEKAQMILDRCAEFNAYGVNGPHPLKMNTGHWTIVIDSWAKSGHPDAGRKASDLIERMDEHGVRLNRVTWNAWIRAHTSVTTKGNNKSMIGLPGSDKDVNDVVENLVHGMEDDIGPHNMQINDYNNLLALYAKQGMALEAEGLVKELVDRYNEGEISCRPDLCSYNSLMDAWANAETGDRELSNIGVRAEMILDEVERRYDEWKNPADTRTYVPAMRAVARSGEENIMDRVLAIQSRAELNGVKPNAFMTCALLDAYAVSDPLRGMDQLDNILSSAEQLEDEEMIFGGNLGGRTAVYNAALKLLTKCQNKRKGEVLAKGEKIFSQMKSEGIVDAVSYSTMITLYGAATGNVRERSKYAAAVNQLLMDLNEDKKLGQNAIVQNTAMYAFIQLGMVARATELLYEMEESYYAHGDRGPLVPSAISYGTIISAWSKSSDKNKVQHAEAIFDRMLKMYKAGNKYAEVTFISYVVLVDVIVKSGEDDAAEKAEKIVRDMYDSYRSGKSTIKPNNKMVTTVIDCWNRRSIDDPNAAERAEALLDWLIDIYNEQDMIEDLMPNEFSFAAAISAWSRSRKFGKATRALSIFDKMVSMNEAGSIKAAPNSYCYTSVIASCAYCVNDSLEKRDSLQIFVDIYKRMSNDEDVKLSHFMFSNVLLALRNLLEPGEKRTAAAKTVFKKTTEKGLCTGPVINRLKGVLNDGDFRDAVGEKAILPNGFVDLKALPADWTCNAQQEIQPKRNRSVTTTEPNPPPTQTPLRP